MIATVARYSSFDVLVPPYCVFFRLPFFGAALVGRGVPPFFGFPRPAPSRPTAPPELFRFRPSLPPFIALLPEVDHRSFRKIAGCARSSHPELLLYELLVSLEQFT
jgi:hypothetical protein